MKITEVRIFQKTNADKKLKAFATITFDDSFVVRDVKIIERSEGLFIAMPSRRAKESCRRCGHGNTVRSKYCNECGSRLELKFSVPADDKAKQNEHKDIAHPINGEFREYLEKAVLDAYEKEMASRKAEPDSFPARMREEDD